MTTTRLVDILRPAWEVRESGRRVLSVFDLECRLGPVTGQGSVGLGPSLRPRDLVEIGGGSRKISTWEVPVGFRVEGPATNPSGTPGTVPESPPFLLRELGPHTGTVARTPYTIVLSGSPSGRSDPKLHLCVLPAGRDSERRQLVFQSFARVAGRFVYRLL